MADDKGLIVDEHEKYKVVIVEKMSKGIPFKYACLLAGISAVTGHRLKALRGEEKERLAALEKQNIWTPEEATELEGLRIQKSLCETFESRCEAARAQYLETMVTRVNLGAIKSPNAAMEILRTQFGDEYNIAKKIEHSGEVVTGASQLADVLQKIYDKEPIIPGNDRGDQDDRPDVLQEPQR